MVVGIGKIQLYANWVHSLKEKRMIVKSLIDKVKHRFNVSIAEVEEQDIHQIIVIGIACISNDNKHVNSTLEKVLNFIEKNTDAMVKDKELEII